MTPERFTEILRWIEVLREIETPDGVDCIDDLIAYVRELEADKARLLALLTSENRPQKKLAEYCAEVENAGIIPKLCAKPSTTRKAVSDG